MTRLKQFWGLGVVLAVTSLIFWLLPLGTAFEMGDDESYEVIKALMCSKGYRLYSDIWNDQPPVSTKILMAAFKLFGASILTARLVAAGFGLLLLGAFHELVRLRSGQRTALIATFLLMASPGVLLLSVSVMLEVPAFATGLLACWLLFLWQKRRHWGFLVASGAVMGIALQIKLTSALILPALAAGLFLACWDESPNWIRKAIFKSWPWVVSLTAVFTIIGLTWGKGALASSWKSHTSSQIVEGMDRPEDHRFEPRLVINHFEAMFAAVAGVIWAVRRKRWRDVAFPIVLLATVSVVHYLHRPWWNYYYLHLAIPIAWLAGWMVSEVIGLLFEFQAKGNFRLASPKAPKIVGICLLAAFVLARSERRWEGAIRSIRHKQSAAANPIVRKMKEKADSVKWVYSESGMYPFHAGLKVPPGIAIVMPKRFWSGQITTARIIEICRDYRVDMIVLPTASVNQEWKTYFAGHYVLSSSDGKSQLYVTTP